MDTSDPVPERIKRQYSRLYSENMWALSQPRSYGEVEPVNPGNGLGRLDAVPGRGIAATILQATASWGLA